MNASKPQPSSSAVGSSAAVAPIRPCLVAARLVRVGHGDFGCAVGACELDHHDADRSRTGDEQLRSSADACLANRCDADRQRFAQRGGVIGDGVRHRVCERRADGHVIAEGPVDRRGAEEPHVRAQVVVAAAGLRAVRVGALRFDRHPLTDARGVDRLADADDRPRRFVAEHQRGVDDEAADPAVAVVVRVGPADADRRHPDQHVTRRRPWHRTLLHLDSTWLDEDGGPHLGIRAGVLCASHSPC